MSRAMRPATLASNTSLEIAFRDCWFLDAAKPEALWFEVLEVNGVSCLTCVAASHHSPSLVTKLSNRAPDFCGLSALDLYRLDPFRREVPDCRIGCLETSAGTDNPTNSTVLPSSHRSRLPNMNQAGGKPNPTTAARSCSVSMLTEDSTRLPPTPGVRSPGAGSRLCLRRWWSGGCRGRCARRRIL